MSSSSSMFNGGVVAPFYGFLGAASALVFSCMGAAYGTARSGVGLVMKSVVPGVIGINPSAKPYRLFHGAAHLAAGLAIGVVGDAGVRAHAQQPKLYVGMILIFSEALALYGLIVGILVAAKAGQSSPPH